MFPAEGDPKGGMAPTCGQLPWLVHVLIVIMVDPNYWDRDRTQTVVEVGM